MRVSYLAGRFRQAHGAIPRARSRRLRTVGGALRAPRIPWLAEGEIAPTRPPRAQAGLDRRDAARRSRERWVAAVADADQHIAQKPVAPRPLDRRSCEQRAKGGVIQLGIIASGLWSRSARVASFTSSRLWRTCSRGRRQCNRRSRKCDCRFSHGIPARSAPCARWSGRRCSAAHRVDTARGRHRSGRS